VHVLRAAAELEREAQAAVDGRPGDLAERLPELGRCWAEDCARLSVVRTFGAMRGVD